MIHQVLLLEDLSEIRAWLKALIVEVFPTAQITECSRVQDALAQVGAGVKIQLALIDLGLPDGSGTDVVAALREQQPEAQTVVVTIPDDDDHLFPALQAGAFGYILKEQSRTHITEQLTRMSQGEPPLSPSIARKVIKYEVNAGWLMNEVRRSMGSHMNFINSDSIGLSILPSVHRIAYRLGVRPPVWRHTRFIRRTLRLAGMDV